MIKPKNKGAFGLSSRVHYAWIVIAIAAVMHMAGGSIRQAFGVLIVPLEENMGWNPATVTLAYAMASITGALLAPISGYCTDRYGARKVIMVGVVTFAAGALLTGVISEVWHLWISYGLFLGVASACFNVPIITTATYWFRTHLGYGVGFLQASHGLGPAVMAIVVSILITGASWKIAFWSIAIIGGTIMLVLMAFFRNRPSDIGVRAFGAPELERPPVERDPVREKLLVKAFRKNMQSTTTFWKLVSIHFLGCVSHSIVIIYIIPIAVLAGMEQVAAAGVLSTLALVSVTTRFLTPVISDYIGARGTMATAFVWQGLPVLMLFWAHDPWQFYLFAVIFGIGYGGEGSAFPVINRQYFGRGPMGSSFGWQQFGAGSGMAMGAWLGGALFWLFDSYTVTIIVSTLTSIAGAVVIMSMEPTSRILIPDWEDSLPAAPAAAGD
ncbi:MAG: MFS transporter [Chloroflexi bacterium]|nr:MFS transporter [Chloroflexota bacterium]MCI0788375.1 MFS transporter [Chloroflexota bacterium]MCI0800744.1 MFS transporter [Chloroflexota bacterium]MCI0809979.1 MFS transporter [Chloroflexota bacterium]MCI0829131.1 MFS transporter [Chloroflexota bacterium]